MIPRVLYLAALTLPALPASAAEYRIEEVPSVRAVDPSRLRPGTIFFTDHRADPIADSATGLIPFEAWAKARAAEKEALGLYAAYAEPTIQVTVNGITKAYKERLHVYMAEARFVVDRPPASVDLAKFGSLATLQKLDPSIVHKAIAPAEIGPLTDPESTQNRHPDRPWCGAGSLCIESRYVLEGKLPLGIRLANKLEDSGKKIAEHVTFQSELRVLAGPEAERAGYAKLALAGSPLGGAVEQSIFWVNQMMQFGKFVALLQPHPSDPGKSIVTAAMALGVETDVLEKKKEYERVPVLRNMVPAQVLAGKSSFNTGTSISAGLPDYARNRVRLVAELISR